MRFLLFSLCRTFFVRHFAAADVRDPRYPQHHRYPRHRFPVGLPLRPRNTKKISKSIYFNFIIYLFF